MTENKNINISISTGTILKTVGIFLILMFAYFIRDVLLTVFIALIFAAVIEPLVNFLESKKIPRGIGIIIIYLVLFLFLVLIVRLIIPPIAEQIALLAGNFPELWSRILENFGSLRDYSIEQGLADNIQQGLQGLQGSLQKAAGGVYSFVISIFSNIVNFILILVIIFYLVVQKDAINKLFKAVAPAKYQPYLVELYGVIQTKIGYWARGQLMLGVIIGALSFIGLIFVLPKYALVLALIAGVTEFIPYLGPVLGAIPAVFLGFTVPPSSFGRGLFILILYVIIQQAEEKFIVPKVMQKQVGLNPVVTIIVMLIGAKLAGIMGLILAIPVATTIGVIIGDFLKRSGLPRLKADLDKKEETTN